MYRPKQGIEFKTADQSRTGI